MSTKMSNQLTLPLKLIMLIHFIMFLVSTTPSLAMMTSIETGFQVDLEHMGSRSSLAKMKLNQQAIAVGLGTSAEAPLPHPDFDFESRTLQASEEFIMNLSIATPPRQFSAIMDTGSNMVWTQCLPCNRCYAQPTPIFDPNTSSSFSPVPCSHPLSALSKVSTTVPCKYTYATFYADGSFTRGYLATETFTLGNTLQNISLPNMIFGCGNNNSGTGLKIVAGIVGLGRGPLSLVSQLNPKRFSYCLPRLGENKKGTLSFGTPADKGHNASNSKGTPLLTNPAAPTRYFVSLEGISLDDTLLQIPKCVFEMKMNGSGGVYLDSGTTFTYLIKEAYQVLISEFASRTRLPIVFNPSIGLDLCFRKPAFGQVSSKSFPKLTFHFKDLELELPQENYMVDIGTRLVCLGMLPTSSRSILGSLLQQNVLVLHDLENQIISFFPNQCA